jgi:hypothetical protein
MEQNKVRTYLLYAVGEILLVVIGILIALQVNNWNEEKKLNQKELEVIGALSEEMDANNSIIKLCREDISSKISNVDSLQNYIGPTYANLPDSTLLDMLAIFGTIQNCNIETNVTDELKSSGSLNLIQSSELRRSISKWGTAYLDLKNEEISWSQEFSTIIIPYMNKWVLWEDIDFLVQTEKDPNLEPSSFEMDENLLLQEYEFSNHLANGRWRMNRIRARIDSLSSMNIKLNQGLHNELE